MQACSNESYLVQASAGGDRVSDILGLTSQLEGLGATEDARGAELAHTSSLLALLNSLGGGLGLGGTSLLLV